MKVNLISRLTVILLVLAHISIKAFGVPACPRPASIKQPDGTTLTVILKGDEFCHYYITEDGFLITKNENGIFNYARRDTRGRKIDTRVKANNISARLPRERNFIKTLDRNPDFSKEKAIARQKRAFLPKSANEFPRTGSPRSLVILVNFSNLNFVTPDPQVAFTDLLNKEGYSANGATGSARDYFIDNSMGAFTPQFDVVGPFTLPNPYEYYGKNDTTDGFDSNPIQMVVDACKVAYDAGIDFSEYDFDNNNVVDNIFIYFAGHNEAENAGADRVWPHRWEIIQGVNYNGTVESITFNGKRILGYACTSELRGRVGTLMAGIGTFTHEFGHVLGLADMYATDGSGHHTLSNWSIMDTGVYLNNGRTPPAYNAFERFQLGYLQPIVLKDPLEAELTNLVESNTAYLISDTSNFRLYAQNTKEYFLLENRQQIGWDAFLPGHGMIVYRINYNASDWEYNMPNNDRDKMGVQMMYADNIGSQGSLAGDPYPGTSNNSIFVPKSRNGNYLEDQPVLGITETAGIISFKYKGGYLSPPVASDATDITYESFKAQWEPISGVSGYYLSVFSIEKDGTKTPFITDKWVKSNHETIYNLASEKEYSYTVKGCYKNDSPPFEVKTSYSNEFVIKTLEYPFKKQLRAVVQSDNSIRVFVPAEEVGNGQITVFTAIGKQLKTVQADRDIIDLDNLPRNTILIIQSGKRCTKVIIK